MLRLPMDVKHPGLRKSKKPTNLRSGTVYVVSAVQCISWCYLETRANHCGLADAELDFHVHNNDFLLERTV